MMNSKQIIMLLLICLATATIGSLNNSCKADEIIGDVRVQVLSPTLVRIELEGPNGFEDRPTFHVTERNWPGTAVSRVSSDGYELVKTSDFTVKVPANAGSLENIVVTDSSGELLWSMPSSTGVAIKCSWTDNGDLYLYDDGDRLGYGSSPVDDRYRWILETKDGYTQFKNKATGDYINLENRKDYVECTPVQPHWDSKDWTLENVYGSQRLLCRWPQMPNYIHVEYQKGYAEHDPAGTSNGESTLDRWLSAQWIFEGESDDFFSNNRHWIPNPSEQTSAWAIVDTPRYVPATPDQPWGGGYNVAPSEISNNGWTLDNDSKDVYVFLPQSDGRQLRSDFIKLTGRTDLIPLYALGGWDSRYYPYTQQEALDKIDTYRSKDIPLDVFVVDTDWRVGASHGYATNEELFPDMEQFITDAHGKNTRIMFNDHPEPQADALDYTEVLYRNDGLRSLFDIGLDSWWYDRNWHTAIRPPDGLNKEVFGMYLYRWVTQDYYPDRRPFIMANVDGIDNGYLNRAPDIAAHRFNTQWTGDTTCDDASLQREILNTVYNGVYMPFAYTSTDLGGHMGTPTVEQYCRWVQFGALSPIFRLHCTAGITRDPWAYPDPAEDVVRDFVQMRMRLLPVFYTASRENYDTGEPILKRCDLNYPEYPQAESNYQYLLGDDILVAPVMDTSSNAVPADWLNTAAGPGLNGTYFANSTLSDSPALTRTDSTVDFGWGEGSPDPSLPSDGFSARWTGTITINADNPVKLGLVSDDGCRLWIDNQLVVDKWIDQAEAVHMAPTNYESGSTHSIKIEYYEGAHQAVCRLIFTNAAESKTDRNLWVPPGTWTNVWTGEDIAGPTSHTASVSLTEMPLFVKSPSIIPLAPQMEYTGEKSWDPVVLDVYAAADQTASGRLYEDDGMSNAYKSGSFRHTAFEASADETSKTVSVKIKPAQGTYQGALTERSWVVRLHAPADWPTTPKQVTVDGISADFNLISRDTEAMPFATTGGSADGDIVEVQIPSASVSSERTVEVQYLSLADCNKDGNVDISDLRLIAAAWLSQSGDTRYDVRTNLDSDPVGKIDLVDTAILYQNWDGGAATQ